MSTKLLHLVTFICSSLERTLATDEEKRYFKPSQWSNCSILKWPKDLLPIGQRLYQTCWARKRAYHYQDDDVLVGMLDICTLAAFPAMAIPVYKLLSWCSSLRRRKVSFGNTHLFWFSNALSFPIISSIPHDHTRSSGSSTWSLTKEAGNRFFKVQHPSISSDFKCWKVRIPWGSLFPIFSTFVD